MSTEKGSHEKMSESRRIIEWITQEDPVTIATHMRVDADAAFSTALLHILRPQASIVFVRADNVIASYDCIAVDLSEGPRSVKGLNVGSAFGQVVKVLRNINRPVHDALSRWAAQLNLTDSGERCKDKVVLAELVICWRSLGFDDEKIVERAEELLRGKILSHKRNLKHREAANQVPMIGKVAIVAPGTHVKAVDLFRRGALAVVRESEVGQCVNLSRYAMEMGISLTEFNGLLPEDWFIHPQGFLACYGSVKAPKNPDESGITFAQLGIVVSTWITSHLVAGVNRNDIVSRTV